jgi:hypothetical protein
MDSFLSIPVRTLILNAHSKNHTGDVRYVKQLDFGFFVLDNKSVTDFLNEFDDKSRERSPEWYNDSIILLSPLFYDCHKILVDHRDELKQLDSCPYLEWIATPKQFKGKQALQSRMCFLDCRPLKVVKYNVIDIFNNDYR